MPYTGAPMTEAMYYVLVALLNPAHGYQLMNEVLEVSKGRVHMGPGTLYGVLSRMQKEGLIVLSQDDGRRKTYCITTEGKQALKGEYKRLKALLADGAEVENVEE